METSVGVCVADAVERALRDPHCAARLCVRVRRDLRNPLASEASQLRHVRRPLPLGAPTNEQVTQLIVSALEGVFRPRALPGCGLNLRVEGVHEAHGDMDCHDRATRTRLVVANLDRERYSHIMQSEGTLHPSSPLPESAPSRHTEKRHATPGNTCNHYVSYNLTCDQYDEMRRRAQERCEICETPEAETTRGALVVDHFDGGGAWFVRGLLCDRCNSVMSRYDRAVVWGPASLPYAERAHEYHLNAFGQLRKAAEYIASRKPFDIRNVPRPARSLPPKRARAPRVHLGHGPKQIARALLRHLSQKQLDRLIELLTEESR